MIFDGRYIDEISDDEIRALILNHIAERQHLEFKATINHRDDTDRLELLLDIASLANGGGGYMVIGIQDDGTGRAQCYASGLVGDVQRIAQAVQGLTQEHLSEKLFKDAFILLNKCRYQLFLS